MNSKIQTLVEKAKQVKMTDPEKFEQRISFAFGTSKIENDNITREMVTSIANKESQKHK